MDVNDSMTLGHVWLISNYNVKLRYKTRYVKTPHNYAKIKQTKKRFSPYFCWIGCKFETYLVF